MRDCVGVFVRESKRGENDLGVKEMLENNNIENRENTQT